MTEQQLRELATNALEEVDRLLLDDARRSATTTELRSALTRPLGEARPALLSALASGPELRRWVGRQTSEPVVIRAISMPPGGRLTPIGIHVVCPQGDYDRFLRSEHEDPGQCPHHGTHLIPASDGKA